MKTLQTFEQFIEGSSMNEANISFYKSVVQQAIRDALGRDVKQSDVKVGAKKQSGGDYMITLNGEFLCSSSQHDVMLRWATNAIKEDPAKFGLNESSVNEGFFRLPAKTIGNTLYIAKQSLNSFYDRVNSGNDVDPKVLDNIIDRLGKVKKDIKSFSKAEDVKGTVYESSEAELKEKNALR